ncbi:uncharacterized protein [Tenebrio molitor]|uniref:uncharacterized protein isoform X8 n=1 Tax=Tenebrio molitor TaxID=7067 RepID=UPI003624886D
MGKINCKVATSPPLSFDMTRPKRYEVAPYREDADQCFPILYNFFCKYGYHKIAKRLNFFCIFCHSIFYLLQVYYLIVNFSQRLITTYFSVMMLLLYMICVTIYLTTLEKTNEKLNGWLHSISWSIDSSGIKAKQIILDRSTRNNRIYYALLPFMLLYAILQTHIQIFLLTEHILHISDNFIDTRNGNIIIDDVLYQDKIKERLCLFTQQHCEIKRFVTKLCEVVQSVMPYFVIVAGIVNISLFFFILNNFSTVNHIFIIRITLLWISTIFILAIFCKTGQELIEETGKFFDALGTCPWYTWNAKNKSTLLIFMANSLKPLSFSFAGVVLDYKLAVTVSIPIVIVKIATFYFKAASNECVVWTGLVSAQ